MKTANKIDVRNPIEAFVASCLTHHCKCKVPEFHRDIYQHLSEDFERLVVEAPRDFAKSTVLSVIYPLYLICCTNIDELQMFSQSGGAAGLSTKWIGKLKKEIESNQVLQALYGVTPGKAWGQDHIEELRHGSTPNIDDYCSGKH